MDGVLDERQKLCDAGIVFRALNLGHAIRETLPRSPAHYTAHPKRFVSRSANTAPSQVRAPAATKHQTGFTRVIVLGSWARSAEAHIFWRRRSSTWTRWTAYAGTVSKLRRSCSLARKIIILTAGRPRSMVRAIWE